MSFNKRYLAPVGPPASRKYAPVTWAYSTTDSLATILAADYFLEVWSILTPGDIIRVQYVDKLPDPNGYGEVWELRVGSCASDGCAVDFMGLVHAGHYVRIPFWINQTDLLAGTAQNLLCPVDGVITDLVTCVQGAVTTGGDITVQVGTTAVSGVSISVADAAAAGTVQSSQPASGETTALVTADGRLRVVPSAAFATAGAVNGYVEVMCRKGNKDYTFFFVNATDYAAGTSHHLPNPLAGTVTKVGTIVQAATTGAQTVTLKADNTTVDGLSITIPTSSAAGAIVTDTPTAGHASAAVDKDSDFEVAITSTPSAGSMAGYIETLLTDPPARSVVKLQYLVNQTDLLAGTSWWMPSPVKGFLKQMNVSCQVGITTGGDVGAELGGTDVLGEAGTAFALATGNSVSAGADFQQSFQMTSLTAEVAKRGAVEQTHASEFDTAGAINSIISVVPVQ